MLPKLPNFKTLKTLKLGTRRSPLARVQADFVAETIRKKFPDISVEPVTIQTSGDRFTGERLSDAGGKSLFVKEIEEALLNGAVDLAVHSLKDLPGETPPELLLAAFPGREDPRDCFVSRRFENFELLPPGATVGSSSPRREAQILALRPGLKVRPIRGNVDTRLKKLEAGDHDAVVLAAAGLKRLGREEVIRHYFEPGFLVPAVGQGILGIEVCKGRFDLTRLLREALNDPETEAAAKAERAFLKTMGGDCFTPLGAYARIAGGEIRLLAWLGLPGGGQNIRVEKTETVDHAEALGRAAAMEILSRGGREILDAIAADKTA